MRTMREMFDHAKSYRVRSVHLGLRVGTVLLPAHIRDIRLAAEVRGGPLAVRQATAFFGTIQGVEDLRCQSGPTAFREHNPIRVSCLLPFMSNPIDCLVPLLR